MKQLLYTLLTLLAALQPAMAQEDNTHVTVNVDGTPLESLLTEEQKAQVTHLTITGTLAEDDYAVLRSMLTNQLEEINLRDADIDTIPANAFSHEPVNDYEAKNIVLPTALKHISANAFPKPGNLSAESVYIWLSGGFPTLGETAIGRHCSVRLTEDNEECKAQGEFIMSTDGETLYYLQADYDFLKIQIPVGTKSIWANVFENVSAVRFIMPETVENIGDRAFANYEVIAVTSPYADPPVFICKAANPPKLGKNVFLSDYLDASVTEVLVPKESIPLYKQAEGWKDIRFISDMTDAVFLLPIMDVVCGNGLTAKDNGSSFSLNSPKTMSKIECFNALGQVVLSKPANSTSAEISKERLPRPCTIMHISFEDGTSETIKLKP